MKFRLHSILLICSVLFLASCKKDNADTNSLTGNYKFVNLEAKTTSTISYTDGGTFYKTITYGEYTTKNNTGSFKIDSKNMISTGLSYSVDTIAKADYYENNEFIDSFEIPLKASVPASDATTGYTIISGDSLYVANGTIFSSTGTTAVVPAGMKYKIDSGKLMFYASQTQEKTIQQQGVPINQVVNADVVVTFQKQ